MEYKKGRCCLIWSSMVEIVVTEVPIPTRKPTSVLWVSVTASNSGMTLFTKNELMPMRSITHSCRGNPKKTIIENHYLQPYSCIHASLVSVLIAHFP